MISKTPKFDEALDEILEKLVPRECKCTQYNKSKYCEGTFSITSNDIEFYKILRVPPPQKCPTCRRQNRFAFVNLINLYKRENNAPDRDNKIISFVPPSSPLIVYDLESYRENFDPYSYAIYYDENINFFDQLFNLRFQVPQPAIIRDPSNINSEYSLNGRNLKNGYYVSGGWNSENVWYSVLATDSRSVMDVFSVHFIENSYELVSCEKCYNCKYLYFSDNCINSQFLYDCNNCIDCFGCVNLRNKSNCIWNIQFTKEDYKKQISEFNLNSRKSINTIKDDYYKELDKIKSSLLNKGEYGEFFPYSMSTFAYNGSLADLTFPLSKDEIVKAEALWQEDTETDIGNMTILPTKEIPDTIYEVNDDILDKAILCEESNRPFRVTESELKFYRRMKLPLPSKHPFLRIERRIKFAPEGKKYKAICFKCQIKIESIFNPKENFILYCDDCYKREVL